MKQSPYCDINRSSASRDICRILWNLNVITMFARVHHLVLPWDRWIHFTPSLPISLRFILILPSQMCLSGLCPSCFSNQNHVCQKIFRLRYLGIDIFIVHWVNKLTKLTNHLHGAETFKLSYWDSWEMLPKGSLPFSQEHATGPCPEPHYSSTFLSSVFL
jgi:hypothetical protein